MSNTDCQLLYCTAETVEEAHRIGGVLVEEKLAACVNILPGMQSVYEWNGAIESGQEVVMIVKTTTDKSREATRRIEDLHSYDCPAILTLDIKGGSMPFLNWIREQVG